MIRCLPILALLLASCSAFTFGTSTTQRPAITKPAIGPDGAFWDAVTVSEKGDREAFMHLLSPQMTYKALFPEAQLREVESQEEFDAQRAQIETDLQPFEAVVQSYAERYMNELADTFHNKFIEVGRPVYLIKFTGTGGLAEGPNTAKLQVRIYPKTSMPEDAEPEVLDITFIQDGRRWLIYEITPDPLKGAFVR